MQFQGRVILVKGTIAIPNTGTAADPNYRKRNVEFKNCAPFTDCISQINDKEIDHANNIDVVMSIHNLEEYSN